VFSTFLTLQYSATHCNTLQHTATGVSSRGQPVCSALFLGPTGVGKTELSKVAVCCSALQCVAVCCRVLYCNAQCVQHSLWVLALCCSALQSVAVHCRVLQCIAECCVVMQSSAVCSTLFLGPEGGSQTELSKSAVRRHNLV